MQLRRALGPIDAVLFFVVAGSNLQWVATAAAAGPSSLAVWLIGCLAMFVPLSIAVVFLSTHYPDEGGLYVWSKRAFGPLAGFITGWTYWASNLPYLPALLYFAAGNALFIAGSRGRALSASPLYFIAVALGGLTLATILDHRRKGALAHLVFHNHADLVTTVTETVKPIHGSRCRISVVVHFRFERVFCVH